MWAFQYKHGDRPLEGFTIQRAAGRGGFGEVYYAVSDSGREVALKVVQGYEAIELRGISQCMNLKSPHLVSIFDVKHNHEGKPFVIMEYVSGPNLRQLLDESPAGLGTQKAAFFLREIAKGLTFLHECGIVHRDLKPANIFYENGYVKIGDYGLSKHITTSQYSGQTVTVGTVHYMAPEIGAGKYDRSIDIYAMGALLYEMLTGTPPYLGSSPTEVLMKHLSSEPDVSGIPQPFARVIRKAMSKDPAQRYQTVQEMVEDVFGAEHVRQSVSVFAPEDLSIIAERVAKRATVAVGAGGGGGEGASSSMPGGANVDQWGRVANWMDDVGGRVKQMWQEPRAAGPAAAAQPQVPPVPINDPLSTRHRVQLALLVSVVAPLAAMFVTPRPFGWLTLQTFLFVLLAMWGGAAGLMLAHRTFLPRLGRDSEFLHRLVAGLFLAGGMLVLSLPAYAGEPRIAGTLAAIIIPFCVFSSREEMAPDRAERVGFGHLFGAGGAAFVLAIILQGEWKLAVAVAAGLSLIVQVLSAWDPEAGARTKAIKEAEEAGDTEKAQKLKAAAERLSAVAARIRPPVLRVDARNGTVEWLNRGGQTPGAGAATSPARGRAKQYFWRPVHPAARIAWVVGIVIFLTMGIMFCVAGGTTRNRYDEGPLIASGVASLLFGLLCIIKALQTRFYGWWGYFVKPMLMTICAASITSSAIILGNLPYNPRQDDVMLGTLFIVLPAILLIVLLFIPGRWPMASTPHQAPPEPQLSGVSPYQRRWALLLAAFLVGGFGGLQRIYVGKVGTGILYLLTGGLFLIGQIVDVIQIFSGEFTDKQGRRLKFWESPPAGAFRGVAPTPPPPAMPPHAPSPSPASAEGGAFSPFDAVERVAAECTDAVGRVVSSVTDQLNAQVDTWRKPADEPPPPPAPAPVHNPFHATPPQAYPTPSGYSRAGGSARVLAEINLRGLLSAVAGLLIFAATLVALALAVDVPGMLHAGVPTPQIRQELETGPFADFPDAWPGLLRRIGGLTIVIMMVFAFTLQVFARQRGGVIHMIRGVVGAAGLMLAMVPLSESVARRLPWDAVGAMVEQQRYPAAADTFLRGFQSEEAVLAGVMFLTSIILLAWPARRMREQRIDAAPSAAPAPRPAPAHSEVAPKGA